MSTFETGHVKNSTNFEWLISYVSGYGPAYNPVKASLRIPALQELLAGANSALAKVNETLPNYRNAVSDRTAAYDPLPERLTRVLNSIISSDTPPQVDKNVRSLVNKIKGIRVNPKKTEAEKQALSALGKETKEISTSQTSFENRLDNLDKLIRFLADTPEYTPNENELKVENLQSCYNDLDSKNKMVVACITPLSNARIARNAILYSRNTGLVDIASDIKAYIKSLFGATSPQYKQVAKLAFRMIKS